MADPIETNPFDPVVPSEIRTVSPALYEFLRDMTENLRRQADVILDLHTTVTKLSQQVSAWAPPSSPSGEASEGKAESDLTQYVTKTALADAIAGVNGGIGAISRVTQGLVSQIAQLPSPADLNRLIGSVKVLQKEIQDESGLPDQIVRLENRLTTEIELRNANQERVDQYILQLRADHNAVASTTQDHGNDTDVLYTTTDALVSATNTTQTNVYEIQVQGSGAGNPPPTQPTPVAGPVRPKKAFDEGDPDA